MGTSRLGFVRRHATGVTVLLLFSAFAALSVLPVPERYQPVRLASASDLEAVVARVFKQPRMTLAKLEAPAPAVGEDPDEEIVLGEPAAVDSADASAAAAPWSGSEVELALAAASSEAAGADDDDGDDDTLASARLPAGLRRGAPVDDDVAAPKRARDRAERKVSKRVGYWRRLVKKLGGSEVKLDNPCVRFDASGCVRTALDPFFAALDAVDHDERGSHATVVTLGNSLIASDHVTDVVRARLVQRFGSGGKGFLLPDRLSKMGGRRVRTGRGTDGWEIHTFAQKPPRRDEFGFTGSMHESTGAGDRVVWKTFGATRARLFYLEHADNPGFTLELDGKPLLKVAPEHEALAEDRTLDLELERGATTLRLTANGKGAVLYGLALSKDAPGVVWDTIGVPASDASMYVGTDEGIFSRQLQAREPSLVVVMIGGNEIRSLSYGWVTLEEVRAQYAALLDRVHKAVPDAACLAVSPIDAARATAAGAELSTRRETLEVVALEREVALEKGCAFYNLFAAMGGEGSLERFHRQGLVNDDLVHPKGAGGDVLGNLLADAMLASYRETPLPREEIRTRRRVVRPPLYGLSFPQPPGTFTPDAREAALAHLFDRLREVEGAKGRRVALGLFGGSHVAAETLPARIRERLQDRFGDGGRGVVGVGAPSERLAHTGVLRKLSGPYETQDGRSVTLGGAMSIFGDKTRLLPGGRFELRLCEDCSESRLAPRGVLELTWLYTPDMGIADVFVNDVQVGTLSPLGRRTDSDVQRLRIPVRGQKHGLSVQVREADESGFSGPVNLFSVAADLARPGVVVDAVGIPATTGMTLQRWRQELLAEQVRARDYDLVAVAWGANEAGLSNLDEATYRYHYGNTVQTLLEASPDASCLIVGSTDRLMHHGDVVTPAPARELIERVQLEVAAQHGCAFFSAERAMGGVGSFARWRQEGLAEDDGVHLTQAGYERLADLLLHDVLGLYAYDKERREQAAQDEARLEVAKGSAGAPATPRKAPSPHKPPPSELGRSG